MRISFLCNIDRDISIKFLWLAAYQDNSTFLDQKATTLNRVQDWKLLLMLSDHNGLWLQL